MIDLASKLQPRVIPQGEQSPPGYLYILVRGMALWCGRVYKVGMVWGEDILINNEALQLNVSALAMTYCLVHVLSGQDLLTTLEAFPGTAAKLTKTRTQWRARRILLKAAEAHCVSHEQRFHGRLYPLYGARYGQGGTAATAADPRMTLNRMLDELDAEEDVSAKRSNFEERKRRPSLFPRSASTPKGQASTPKGPDGKPLAKMKTARRTQRFDSNFDSVAQATATLYGAHRMRRELLESEIQRQIAKEQVTLHAHVISLSNDIREIKQALNIGKEAGQSSNQLPVRPSTEQLGELEA